MKHLKLIYNPFAGDKSFRDYLDEVIAVFQDNGMEVSVFRSNQHGDIERFMQENNFSGVDIIAVAGGDGTVNKVVSALVDRGLEIPVGIFPSGTANDFSSFLGMSKDFEESARIISEGYFVRSDLGSVNGKCFINICAAGLLTNVSQNVDVNLKNTFGMIAYYLKGIEQIPNFEPIPVRITNSTEVIEDDIYIFAAMNSTGVGGYIKLSPEASITDGKLDFIAVKARPLREIAVLLIKMLTGDYLSDDRIIHFKDEYIKVEYLKDIADIKTDIDGEAGPDMPAEIRVLPSTITFFAKNPEK